MEKFQPPEGKLPHGELEDEEMNLGEVPVCEQRCHQLLLHLSFLKVWIYANFNSFLCNFVANFAQFS